MQSSLLVRQLRDYGYEGQWGLEPTFQMYLENELIKQKNPVVEDDDDDDEEIFEPVHDEPQRTLH